ncbi:uncharacterized protein LOC129292476 [Prosopis cineraria]|uniref:uncharacterized protein LOC129292476 n=1 Tax=Prosopis cineraria TaxID=364024 RepID=UPI00240FFB7A|nr:uncharacterized protein LOC129292476 [Prosopis cineraria]
MALELGLKITRTRAPDNATSISELRISKSREGPVFVSTETHATFILTCYLKGYHRNSFEIKISEDGKEISINGEKPVQEILMMGRVMLKKNVETVGFRKVFKIPCGVVLDRISAKFDEDESLLKIVMPKLVKGICGVQIEEVRKEEGFGESSQKASEIGENESVFKLEEGLSDKKLVESTNGNVTADTIQKEIESPRFEAMKKSDLGENVCHTPKNIEDASPEVLKVPVLQPLEETENIMLGGPPGITGEDKFKGTPKGEVEEVKFENGSKDEERVQTEISKEGLEARDTTMQGRKSEKVLAGAFRTSEEDIFERTQIKETKLECESKDEERVGTKISEKGHAKREGTEVSKGGLESIDATMEEREPEKVFARAFGINGEAIDEGKQKKEIEDTNSDSEGKFEERWKLGREDLKQKKL